MLSPLDAATQVAVPEFDGRLITVPFSFKEIGPDGLPAYVRRRRAGRPRRRDRGRARAAAPHRPSPPPARARPVGLPDQALADRQRGRPRHPGQRRGPADAAARGGLRPRARDRPGRAAGAGLRRRRRADPRPDRGRRPRRGLAHRGASWPATRSASPPPTTGAGSPRCRSGCARRSSGTGARRPVRCTSTRPADPEGDIVLAALRAGNLLVLMQPPRGFGENPIAIYHDPDLPPSHHYLAAYRWIAAAQADGGFGADAVVHLGKHGNLEWLPGKNAGLSAACGPDAVARRPAAGLPVPRQRPRRGHAGQAPRPRHARRPPRPADGARRVSYGDIARLEQLLDEYAKIAALDPAKLPAVRAQIWTLHPGRQAGPRPGPVGPSGRRAASTTSSCTSTAGSARSRTPRSATGCTCWGRRPARPGPGQPGAGHPARPPDLGRHARALPGLREALGLDESAADRGDADRAEERARAVVERDGGREQWRPEAVQAAAAHAAPEHSEDVAAVLDFAVRRGRAAAGSAPPTSSTHVVTALGRRLRPGRPVRLAAPRPGQRAADRPQLLLRRPEGRSRRRLALGDRPGAGRLAAGALPRRTPAAWPQSVGLSVWGTSAMRTSGDDIAEVLALLGVRPVWDDASRRVTGLRGHPARRAGPARASTSRCASPASSGTRSRTWSRLLDDAVRLVAALDEPDADNYVRRARRGPTWPSTATSGAPPPGSSAPRPGTYGAGLLPLIDARDWRTDADLAEVYAVWGGYAYGRGLDGRPARGEMETAYRRIAVAAKNTDTREHDIVDSDDYFQYHGGMVAMVRALTGTAPAAYIGDSHPPGDGAHPHPGRGDLTASSAPGWSTRGGWRRCGGTATRAPSRWRPPSTTSSATTPRPAWSTTGCTRSSRRSTSSTRRTGSSWRESNPWALHGMTERLLEAAERGLWAEPDPETLDALRQVYLETEGDLEDRGSRA